MMKSFLAIILLLSSQAKAGEPQMLSFEDFGRISMNGIHLPLESKWNECEGSFTGNYVGFPCSKVRGMDDAYVAFLTANLFSCVNAGLANVDPRAGAAKKVHIIHDGTLADTAHKKTSLHAVGRAVDIMSMNVVSASGTWNFDFKVTSSQPQGTDRKFYEGFRSCWNKLQVARSCPARDDGFPIGTIGWEDARHAGHHLHTSMPFCPDNKGFMKTFFPSEQF